MLLPLNFKYNNNIVICVSLLISPQLFQSATSEMQKELMSVTVCAANPKYNKEIAPRSWAERDMWCLCWLSKTFSFEHRSCWCKAYNHKSMLDMFHSKLGFLNFHETYCVNSCMSCSEGLERECRSMGIKAKASRSRKIWVCPVSFQTVWNRLGGQCV